MIYSDSTRREGSFKYPFAESKMNGFKDEESSIGQRFNQRSERYAKGTSRKTVDLRYILPQGGLYENNLIRPYIHNYVYNDRSAFFSLLRRGNHFGHCEPDLYAVRIYNGI